MFGAADFSSDNPSPHERSAIAPARAIKICALLPEVETVNSCLQCAVAASRGFSSDIRAVHVGFGPRNTLASAEEVDIQQLRDVYEGKPEVRLARIKAAFDNFVSTLPKGPPIRWKNDEGDIGAFVADEALNADLIVIGQPIHLDASDALHCALFNAHRLVLVAPRNAHEGGMPLGRHIIVGWKPGEPIQHAVEAAMPWLKRAEKVSALWVEKHDAESYEDSARQFFEKIEISFEIISLKRNDLRVGAQLLGEASRMGGDCLLIGAFKHSALWDALLGGVTRDVLTHAEIPVFLMR